MTTKGKSSSSNNMPSSSSSAITAGKATTVKMLSANNAKVTSTSMRGRMITTIAAAAKTTKTATVYPTLFPASVSAPNFLLLNPAAVTTTVIGGIIKTTKTTTEAAAASEITKKIKEPQTPGDILAFVALTLGSYIVGALLAIIFRALYKYVQGQYHRKRIMIKLQQRSTAGDRYSPLAGGANGLSSYRGRILESLRPPDQQRRLSTIYEAPAGLFENGDETMLTNVDEGGENFAAALALSRVNSASSMPCFPVSNRPPPSPSSQSFNSYLVRKLPYPPPQRVPIIKMQPPSPLTSPQHSNCSPALTKEHLLPCSYYDPTERHYVTLASFSSPAAKRFIQTVNRQQNSLQNQLEPSTINHQTQADKFAVIECFGDGADV